MYKLVKSLTIATAGLFSASAHAVDCSSLSSWSASQVYTGGDTVQTSGSAYSANWWTQGNDPVTNSGPSGSGQPWKSLGACDTGGSNQNPVANANGPYSGTVGSNIAFSSAGSSDSDGQIVSYSWNFGDGASSSAASPAHVYTAAGNYTVALTVTDDDGASSTASTSATISGGTSGGCNGLPAYSAGQSYSAGQHVSNVNKEFVCNVAGWCSSSAAWAYEPGVGAHWQDAWSEVGDCSGNAAPSADANGPYSGTAGSAISFSSAGSVDPDGQIVGYSWSFGDGGSATGANPTHTYANPGNYTVTLTVTDNSGASGSGTTTATITSVGGNLDPVANANGPYSGIVGASIAFSSAGSQDADGNIVSYAWSFGDGANSSATNPTHAYASAGNYTVSLTVTDDEGATNTISTTATINTSNPPTGNKKVVGYFTEWGVYGRNYHIKNLVTSGSADKLTHIVYSFGNVQNGECKIGDSYAAYDKYYDAGTSVDGTSDTWDAGALRGNFNQIRKLKAMYPNIKVVWSFGGWTWSGGFGQAAANAQAFADSCYNLVNDARWSDVFDGIDIDWEYPNACGLSCDSSGPAAYTTLIAALRARFGNQLVTSAIGAGSAKLNAADYGPAAQYLDFYMLMTYDFFGAFDADGPTAPHSPLTGYAGIPIADFHSDNGVQLLKSFGVPSEKILLGIGFYGRGWTGVSQSAPGGAASGAAQGTYEAGIEDYKVLKNSCPATGVVAGTAYAYCGNNWWSYDTPATIQGKMNYVNQQGLGGAFFWEFSGDTANGELIQAISDGL